MLAALLLAGGAATATATSGSVRTPGVTYRSVLGDPGMRWKPGCAGPAAPHSGWLQRPAAHTPPAAAPAAAATGDAGPRMQLFFYGLCSKAGYSNVSVVPAASDTCETRPGVIGLGVVSTVNATDCCAACLAQPWCLAWTQTRKGACDLKDNALAAPSAPSNSFAKLGQAIPGGCGTTTWKTGCNSSSTGAWKAKDHG